MCGVVGVIHCGENHSSLASLDVYQGLLALQHRGQDAAGILSFDSQLKKFFENKDEGLVAKIFDEKSVEALRGQVAIGHTRYSTIGKSRKQDIQPLVRGFPLGVGMVHNGNTLNYTSLSEKLSDLYSIQSISSNDLELLMNLFCYALSSLKGGSLVENVFKAAHYMSEEVEGAYSLISLISDLGLVGMRDIRGVRPICLGKKEIQEGQVSYCLASEDRTLDFLGYEFVRDLEPGEILVINYEGELYSKKIKSMAPAHCMFEWVYFSGAESTLDQRSVYSSRLELGKALALKIKPLLEESYIKADVVCPVPDTSRTAAIALSEELGLPYREGLIKNRYIQRSFILNTQEQRERAVALKLSPVRSEIKDKNILLVDDSIVRGTTSKKIVNLLRSYGAKKISLALTCPPIKHPCFYGIDFPNPDELVASRTKGNQEIAQSIGVDHVVFIDEKDLIKSIGTKNLCMGCLNQQYPSTFSGDKA